MKKPLFSIVVPAYRRDQSIVPSLQSVLAQTIDDWECIVVDDGSPNSAALMAEVEAMGDSRFRYIWRPNGGGGAARNTGVQNASGRYIAYLDSDDLFLPNKLEVVAAQLPEESARVCLFSYVLMRRGPDADWRRPDRPLRPGESITDYYFAENQHFNSTALVVPRALALDIPWDPTLRKMQDVDLLVRLAAHGTEFRMIEEVLCVWVDDTEDNRASRHPGYEAPLAWLQRNQSYMSERAYFGFRATLLAYFMAHRKPVTALYYLWQGWTRGRVPTSIIVRQFLRCYLPRRLYRQLVNRYVRARGHRQMLLQPRD